MPSGSVLPTGWQLARRAPALLALVAFSVTAGETVDVAIAEYRYAPAEIHIHAGDSVRWSNREKRTSHSVLFSEEGGLESERLFPEESWVRQFDKPGRYPYHCGPHPEMQGVVLVD